MKLELMDGYIEIGTEGTTWVGNFANDIRSCYWLWLRKKKTYIDSRSTLIYFLKEYMLPSYKEAIIEAAGLNKVRVA